MQDVTLIQLLICSLATWQAVETWRHGSIFAGLRKANRELVMKHQHWLIRKFGEGLNCPFCLPHWVAGLWALLIVLSPRMPFWLSEPCWTFALALAITRSAQALSDLFKATGWSQSPPGDLVVEDETIQLVD